MPCAWLQTGNLTAIICGVPRRKKKFCYYCGESSDFLCDYPVGADSQTGKKKTCDRALCAGCARQGISDGVDFCKGHYPLARAAYLRRQARKRKGEVL